LEKGKGYIAEGYRQLYQYTLDFNEPTGYMVIFKTCQEDLRFALTNQTQATPFVVNNNKTVYFLTIDICDYQKPASKRGVLKVIEITQEELIRETGA
jgi:hypothetical protein